MKPTTQLLWLALFASASAAGPVASGPDNVPTNTACAVTLDPGSNTNGYWSLDWGDGSAVQSVPVNQLSASHTYATRGVFTVKTTLRNNSNIPIDVQRNYDALVRKGGASVYYRLNGTSTSGNIGPAFTRQGTVMDISSFSASCEGALRFTGAGYLRVPDRSETEGQFLGLEFWLRPNNLTTKQVIYAGTGTADGNALVYIENGNLCFELVGAGVKSVLLGADVEAGRWYHFGVSFERSPYFMERNTVRLYRDGVLRLDSSYSFSESRPIRHNGATIGAYDLGGGSMTNHLNGDLDEVVIHPLGIFPGTFLERYEAATSNEAAWKVSVGADGSDSFTVNTPVITNEVLVELDPDPLVDNRVIIQTKLNTVPAGTRLKFVKKGTTEGGGRYHLLSHHDWKLLRIEKDDIEIDGNGVELIVKPGATKYITIANVERILVKNLSFDINENTARAGAYAKVEEVDTQAKTMRIRYVKGTALLPDNVPAGIRPWRGRRVDNESRNLKKAHATATSSDINFSINHDDPTTRIPDPSDASRWTYRLPHGATHGTWKALAEIKAADELLQINCAHFGGSGVSMWNCKHVTFDQMNFHSVMGMVFLSSSTDYLKVANCKVGLPPGMTVSDRPFAAAADAFHFHGFKGGHVIFENNDVAMTDDDPISIKDGVFRNVTKKGTNLLKLEVSDEYSATIGSMFELRKLSLEPLSPPFSAQVVSYDSSTKIATLSAEIPGAVDVKYHAMSSVQQTENWIIRGSNFHDLYGRFMLYTGGGLLENNRITGIYSHVGFSAADYDNAGRPHDIVFRNNFHEGGYGDTSVWEAWPTVPIIHNIEITNNSMLGGYWSLANAGGMNLSGNYFEQSPSAAGALVRMKYSDNVNIVGNLHYDPIGTQWTSVDNATFAASENVTMPFRNSATDVIVDNSTAVLTGTWGTSAFNTGQFFGANYRWSSQAGASAKFTPNLPVAGTYRVYAMWNNGADRARTAPFQIMHAGGVTTVQKSQRTSGGVWVYLGTYTFSAGTSGNVTVSVSGANGLVIADAVRFQQ